MEFTQFISYLDYGVLGLSAIILILSFVLLSREQKREVFRPEVASAIRKYMMLALAFAGVGLISTIVDGVMVQPAKEEQKLQEERTDLLSRMIAEDVDKRIDLINGEAEVLPIPPAVDGTENIDVPEKPTISKPKDNKPEPEPKPKPNENSNEGTTATDTVVTKPGEGTTEVDSIDSANKTPELKKEETEEILVIIKQYHLNEDEKLGKGVVDNLKEINVPAANIIEQRLLNTEE